MERAGPAIHLKHVDYEDPATGAIEIFHTDAASLKVGFFRRNRALYRVGLPCSGWCEWRGIAARRFADHRASRAVPSECRHSRLPVSSLQLYSLCSISRPITDVKRQINYWRTKTRFEARGKIGA